MTPEYLKTVFDPFTRAENSTTNKVQGTGLGMAITKNIVELMGGTIQVSSEIDRGSIFTVELELRIPDGQADEQFWKDNNIRRILAVDDDEEVCKSVQALMGDTKTTVDTAPRVNWRKRPMRRNRIMTWSFWTGRCLAWTVMRRLCGYGRQYRISPFCF